MPELHYSVGSGLLVSAADAAILLAAPVQPVAVEALLRVLRDDDDPLQGVLTALSGGPIDLVRLPDFALIAGRDAKRRVLLRGAVEATVDGAEHTGLGSSSWLEVPATDRSAISVRIVGAAADDPAPFLILDGAVPCGAVSTSRTRDASASAMAPDPTEDGPPDTLSTVEDYEHLFISRLAPPEPPPPVPRPEPVAGPEPVAVAEPADDPGHLDGTLPLGDHDGHTVRAAGAATSPWGIEVSTGERIALGTRTVIGRRPVAPLTDASEQVRLVRVPSPSSDISRSHVEITSTGGQVVIRDLSTNGTVLLRLGERMRIRSDEPVDAEAEDVLDLGDGVTVRFVAEP